MQKSGSWSCNPVHHLAVQSWHTPSTCLYLYKCIRDDTKAAARQSPNCIKNKINMAKNDFQYGRWNYYTLQCGTIMILISPGDCTLQCGKWLWNHDNEFTKWQHPAMSRWLWDDMPWNSPKRPPCWNSTSGFDFDHITAFDMSFCTSLRNFIQIGPPSAEKNDVMSIFKMADLSHLGF